MIIFNRMKKTMIKNDNFSMIFEGFASKEKIKQNLGNHQKIIVLLEKPWKSKILASFLVLIKQNDDFLMIFWWFLKVLLQTRKSNKT